MDIHNSQSYFKKKTVKPKFSIPFNTQLLIKGKQKIKKAFIKIRTPSFKSAFNAISLKLIKIKKDINSHWSADIKKKIQCFQLSSDPQSWRTLKIEMSYPSKGSAYLGLKNGAGIVKTDPDKLKHFAEQLKSVFATKTELKD